MQKDIRSNKGETTNTKEGDKLRQVGHDVNASLKENVGVGVGNYSSTEDRQRSNMYEKSHDLKEQRENIQQQNFQQQNWQQQQDWKKQQQNWPQENFQQQQDWQKQQQNWPQENFQQQGNWQEGERKTTITNNNNDDVTGAITHKVKEIGREINATLKQNVGIGIGNYSSEVDKELANEHKEKYEEKIEDTKKQVEETKKQLEEKKEELKDKMYEGTTGKYTHRVQQLGHDVNAALKENIGIGVGDYPSEKDRELSKEHWENFQDKVKEEQKAEVTEGTTIGHKIKEVVHNLNANLKEMIGVGFGNYSSEVDRELATLHKEKYEEKIEEHQIDTDLKEDKDELKKDLREKKDDVKSDLREKKNEVKSDLREKKDELKSDFREKKNEIKSDLREKKEDLKDKKL